MWRNFRFCHIYLAYKSDISPHDKFFSTHLTTDISDKYQVWASPQFLYSKRFRSPVFALKYCIHVAATGSAEIWRSFSKTLAISFWRENIQPNLIFPVMNASSQLFSMFCVISLLLNVFWRKTKKLDFHSARLPKCN